MSHYTMLYKYGKRTRDFVGRFYCYFSLVFYILGAFLTNYELYLSEYKNVSVVENAIGNISVLKKKELITISLRCLINNYSTSARWI